MHRSNEDDSHRSIKAADAPGHPPAGAGEASLPFPPGTDFLQLDVAEAPARGRSDWLAGRLRQAIADGLLPVGSRLPASRVLAGELRVSRGVVTEAYRRLAEDGHVAGRGRNGTVVLAAPLATPSAATAWAPEGTRAQLRTDQRPGGRPAGAPFDDVFDGPPGDDVFDALRALPARIDLSPGVPDLAAFPRAGWLRAERAVLGGLPTADLGYGDPRGLPALRRAVAHRLARDRGIRAEPEEILITSGTAQALGLLTRVLRDAGVDRVAVEDPGSLGVRQHLRHGGVNTPPVAVDAEGVRVDALRATGAATVLLTPAHQFPTGVVLQGARRRELLRWAADGGLVIEDDYDAEHRYDRPPVPALRSALPERVCHLGSVSKLLAPALRLGWLLAPPALHGPLVEAKRFADLGSAVLPQAALAHLMVSGTWERQLRTLRRRHRQRRDAMVHALRREMSQAVVHGAAAGLHLTVTLEDGTADAELAAAALHRGVKVHPLSWHTQRPGTPGLVLGYAARTPTEIAEGVAALGAALRAR